MEEQIKIEQKESIKLTKNTKGYNWEIKTFIIGDDETIQRLEELDNKLKDKFQEEIK